MPKCGSLVPADYTVWVDQVRHIVILNQWDKTAGAQADQAEKDAAKARRRRGIIATRAALEGELAITSAHLVTASYDTVEEYLKALSELVTTPAGQQLAEEQFRTLRQSPEESVLQFAARVRSKFREAYPGVDHENSRDHKRQLITGLNSPHLAQSVARMVPLDTTTFSKLVNEIQRLYASDLMVLTHHHSRKGAGGINALHYSMPNSRGGSNPRGHQRPKSGGKSAQEPRDADGVLRNRAGETVKCYECDKNHYARNCPTKQKGENGGKNSSRGGGKGKGGRGGGRGRGGVNSLGAQEGQEPAPPTQDPSGQLDQQQQYWDEQEKGAFDNAGN